MVENSYHKSLNESMNPDLPGKISREDEKKRVQEEARERLREGEDIAQEDDTEENGRSAKLSEKVGDTAIKYATRGKIQGAAKMIKAFGKAKKLAPALVVLLIIAGFAIFVASVQSLMPFALINQLIDNFNSVTVSPAERSNEFLNMQLATGRGESDYGETVYDGDEFGLSDYQKTALADVGIEYNESDDGTKSLVYTNAAGEKVAVVADTTVSGLGAEIAATGEISSDAMSEEDRLMAAKSELIARLDTSDVKTVSEALKDKTFKKKYTKGTMTYRGTVAGWFESSTEDTYKRLGLSKGRDTYSGWESTGNYEEDYKKFVEKQKSDYANEGSVDADGTTTYDGLKAKAKEVASQASSKGCKAMSAIQETHSAVAAQQRYMQEGAASGYLESIQKTQSGDGSAAPLNIYNNQMTKPDSNGNSAMSAKGIAWMFGSGGLKQDEAAFAVSSESNASTVSGTVEISSDAQDDYNACNYIDSTSGQTGRRGFFNTIAAAFNKVGSFIKSFWNMLTGASDGTDEILEEIDPALKKYSEMLENEYFTDTVGPELGDATVQASQQIMTEVSKGEGMSIANEEIVKTGYQKYQEVLADRAEVDREEKSPFDISSPNTFLGSLVQKTLVPMAVSLQSSTTLTKLASTFSNLASNSLTSLLPTSSAADQAEFIASSVGDCPVSGSTGTGETTFSVSNAYCNQYTGTDFATMGDDVLSNFEEVAKLRYDNRATQSSYSVVQDPLTGVWYLSGVSDAELHNVKAEGYFWINTKDDNPCTRGGACTFNYIFSNDMNGRNDIVNKDSRKWTSNPIDSDLMCVSRMSVWYYAGGGVEYIPLEWSYNTTTNFKHTGFVDGYPTSEFSAGQPTAQRKECTLDMKIDNKNPDINQYSALGEYIMMSGQRVSNWGVLDADLAKMAAGVDLKHGAWHEPTDDEIDQAAHSEMHAARISGSAFSATHDQAKSSNKIFMAQNGGTGLAWEYENQYYQRYVEDQALLESIRAINKSSVTLAVADYHEVNPLDNSIEGIIARYSGQKKETVVAVLDLLNYANYIAQYDPTDLYPLPVRKLRFDYSELTPKDGSPESGVVALEKVRIQYAPLRNRYKTITL